MAEENAGWEAPKIHAELLKLGFVVSERSVTGYLRRVRGPGNPRKNWLTFLANHREVFRIASLALPHFWRPEPGTAAIRGQATNFAGFARFVACPRIALAAGAG